MPNATRTITTAVAFAAIMSAASAQTKSDKPVDTDALRGPAVTAPQDDTAPNRIDRPNRGRKPGSGLNNQQAGFPVFLRAVRALDRQETDTDLKLNEGQRAVIEVMLNEHTKAMEAWRENNRGQLQDLRENAKRHHRQRGEGRIESRAEGRDRKPAATVRGQRRGQGQVKGQSKGKGQGKGIRQRHGRLDDSSRQEFEALMQTRPSAEAQRAQIWDILTPAQRQFVDAELEKPRTRAKAGKRSQRLGRPNGDDQARPKSKRQQPRLLEGETPEQFEQRMLERIEQLPKERQEQALDRLNRAMQRMNQNKEKATPAKETI